MLGAWRVITFSVNTSEYFSFGGIQFEVAPCHSLVNVPEATENSAVSNVPGTFNFNKYLHVVCVVIAAKLKTVQSVLVMISCRC